MDKKYITLFNTLAQATTVSAEQVMDYNHEKGDEKGYETAKTMRDDFQELYEKLQKEDYTMSQADAARLLVAAMIQTKQIETRIETLKQAMTGYQTDIIPKLKEVSDAETDEAASQIAEEKFIITQE